MPVSVALGALLAVTIWGASPVATKIAVVHLSPLVVAVLRTVIGGAAAFPLALAMRVPLPVGARQRAILVLSGLCGFIAFPMLFSIGQQQTSAIHGSLILAVLPVFTGAYAMAWDRRWPSSLWWIGCAIALVGEGLLVTSRGGVTGGTATLTGDAIVFASTLFASLGYVAGGRLQQAGYPSTGTTFWGVVIGGVLLAPTLFWIIPAISFETIDARSWGGVLYLAIGVTIIGYVLWYWALGRGGIARMGLFQFLQPVSGVLLAAVLLGEALTIGLLAATALILGGVMVAQRGK